MKALDLFAGARGWSLGARLAGIEDDGVEIMPAANATAKAAGFSVVHDDVWTMPLHWLDAYDGQITSPPCQTFSKAGGGSGRKNLDKVLALIPMVEFCDLPALRRAGEATGDDRTALVLTPLWYALHAPARTRWLAWEQVPSVLPVWEACAVVLRAEGWHVWTGYLHSEQYGVPQTRKRAFLIASKDHPVGPPTPTHSAYHQRDPLRMDLGVRPWVSMAEALGWPALDCPVYVNGTGANAARRPASRPAPTVLFGKRVNKVTWECTCAMDLTATNPRPNGAHRTPCKPAPTMAFGHETPRWNPRETTPDGLERFAQQSANLPDYGWPDRRPATVVAGRDLVGAPGATANRFNGSTKSRNDGVRVSIEEAGVLQSFPWDHPWQGKKSDQFLQAGNAVPPLMARAVLEEAAYGIL